MQLVFYFVFLCDKNIQKKENGRIYFIVIDNEIYKIGSSECKGGIKNTFAFYEGGLGGSPSISIIVASLP